MAFKKATKEQAKLRLAIFGPSGAGKTYTALRIAAGLGGNVALIDTERNSASKYADRFNFDSEDLATRTINGYVAAIKEAAQANYAVLIIDSLSHAWQELLAVIDKLAKSKYKGNTWSAWSEGTPQQKQLVDAILSYPGHIIVTMRSKTEWVQETTDGGKTKPVRVGLSPEQGKGIEYEFDLLLELSVEHVGVVLKDRTGKFQDQTIDRPGEEFGAALAAWLLEGAAPTPTPATPIPKPTPATVIPAATSMKQPFQCAPELVASLTRLVNAAKELNVAPEEYLIALTEQLGSRDVRSFDDARMGDALEIIGQVLQAAESRMAVQF